MGNGQLKAYINKYGQIVRGGLLFLLIYLFLCMYVDLRLVYHVFGATDQISGFICRYRFLHESLITPGGMLNYISTFIEQFYMFQWIGPLFLIAVMCLLTMLISRAFKKLQLKGAVWAMYCPAIILTIFYYRYSHQLEYALALLVSLILFNVYISFDKPSIPLRLTLFTLLFVLQFHFALASCFILAVLCVITELVIRGRGVLSVLIALVSAVVPYLIGVSVFSLSLNDAYAGRLPFSWRLLEHMAWDDGVVPISILYLAVPVWLLLCGTGSRIYAKKIPAPASRRKDRKQKKNRHSSIASGGTALIGWTAVTLLLTLVTCSLLLSFQKKSMRGFLKLQLLCSKQKWSEVLKLSLENPTDIYGANARNRALYHMSSLPEDMFKYPQNIRTLIITDPELDRYYWTKVDLAISLGLCDLAQEYLVETMVDCSDHPDILKKLAYVHMAKGDIKSATVYLGALSEMMFYSDWANEYLLKLKEDPSLASDTDIQRTRQLNLSGMKGFVATPYGYCVALLRDGKKNRMAYEYAVAYCLLAGEKGLGELPEYIKMFGDYGYEKLPKSYQEGILIYNSRPANKNKKIVLDNYKISNQTHREFDAFHKLANSFKTAPQAQRALAGKYTGTYYYYYYYMSNRY